MNFRSRGYQVLTAKDGDEGMQMAFDRKPDLVVLDLMLPGYSGFDILDELRERGEGVPVLILSARGSLNDKVKGLGMGADDYLPKPFELPELLARVEALLRRNRARMQQDPPLCFGDLVIQPSSRMVTLAGEEVVLSAKEFEILCLLARQPDRVYSRDEILEHVWGWGYEGTARTVDNYILSLRRKLETCSASGCVRTIRQAGYRFDPPVLDRGDP